MCGRFELATPAKVIAGLFRAAIEPETAAQWLLPRELAPQGYILSVTQEEASRRLSTFRWGLVPSWAKDLRVGARMFNARAETIATKPSFSRAFAMRRAIIPADAFFEWRHVGKKSEKYEFRRADGDPLAFAGLWESWHPSAVNPASTLSLDPLPVAHEAVGEDLVLPATARGSVLKTCTIITTSAGLDLAGVHDRMPVVLEASSWSDWLDESSPAGVLHDMLHPSPQGTLLGVRVGDRLQFDGQVLTPELDFYSNP